jgi:hypothetical protein
MANLEEAKEKLQQFEALAAKLRQAIGGTAKKFIGDIRASDLARKNAARRESATLVIHRPEDIKRRARLERNVYRWLRWYLPHIFVDPFREHHIEMIRAILDAATNAGDQAIAAPRGEAKTTIAECVTLFCILKGLISFSVIFAATAGEARASLASIKQYIEDSDRLAADYPEISIPVRHAAASPQRAHSMLVRWEDSNDAPTPAQFQWSGEEITMPNVPGSVCAGSIIATRGLDSAVRGLKRGTRRPQLAIIDDPDTEDTARSQEQAAKLAERIERAIAGLAPSGKRMSRVMLTTLQNKACASAQFTDSKRKPSWGGRRFRFLLNPPNNPRLWEEYIRERREGQSIGDKYGRSAHAIYLKKRRAMDAGAVVCNPKSFDGRRLADGTRLQVSALQRYYDFVADNGEEAALAELQNDPADATRTRVTLTAEDVARKLNGLARGVVPLRAQHVTGMVDVHDSLLYWLVAAWEPDFTG